MNRIIRRLSLVFLSLALSLNASAETLRVYVGTFTGKQSKGIYVMDFDSQTGEMSEPRLAVEVASPSFLTIHPNGKYLYAVSESGGSVKGQGELSAFAINTDGTLKLLNHQPSGGSGPCYVSVDPGGHVAMLANYGSGSFESLAINDDGTLSEPTAKIQDKGKSVNPSRQEGPHAHSINPDPAGKFAFGCDLGTDQIVRFEIDSESHSIKPIGTTATTPGVGPRHLAFHPSGKLAFIVNELGNSVTEFHYDKQTGEMTDPQTIGTLPEDFHGNNWPAEVQVHPGGRWVFASNRGDDSIAVFELDKNTGRLSAKGRTKTGGKFPRNFRLDPDGNWLLAANQDSGTVTELKFDRQTGALQATGKSVQIGMPVCVKFLKKQ